MDVTEVTEETLTSEVLERSRHQPVVVDFWAEWCGPCHALAPVLERAVAARDGAIALAKVDIDASPELAARYGVRGIPVVKAFRRGEVVSEFAGAQPRDVVEAFLDALLVPAASVRLLAELSASGELPEVAAALEQSDFEAVLEVVLRELTLADGERRERLRDWLVELFAELGQEHPLSLRYRRLLASALF